MVSDPLTRAATSAAHVEHVADSSYQHRYRGGLTVDGWRTWRTCLDVWMTLPACDFLKFLEHSMEEEND